MMGTNRDVDGHGSVLDDWTHDRMVVIRAADTVAMRWMTGGTAIGLLGLGLCFPMNDAVMMMQAGPVQSLPLIWFAVTAVFSALSIVLPVSMLYGRNRDIRNDPFARRFRLAVMRYKDRHSRLGVTRFLARHGIPVCLDRFGENVRRALPSWFGGRGDIRRRLSGIGTVLDAVSPLDDDRDVPREVIDLLDSVIGFREEPSDDMAERLTDVVTSRIATATGEYRQAAEERTERHADALLGRIGRIGPDASTLDGVMTARARLDDMVRSMGRTGESSPEPSAVAVS